eukprot:gene21387-27417_t
MAGSQSQLGWSEQWSSQVRPPNTFTKKIISQIFEKKSVTSAAQNKHHFDEYLSNLESGIEVFTESDVELKEMVVVPTTLSFKMHAAELSRGYYIGNCDNIISNPIICTARSSEVTVTSGSVDLFGRSNAPLNKTTPLQSSSFASPSQSIVSSAGLQTVCKDIDDSLSVDLLSLSRVNSIASRSFRSHEVVVSPSSRFPAVDPLNMTFIETAYSQNAETTHSAVTSALTTARSSRAASFDASQVSSSASTISTVQQLRADELHERLSALAKQQQESNNSDLFISTDSAEVASPTKRRFTSSLPSHRTGAGVASPSTRVTSPLSPPNRSAAQQSNCDLKYVPVPMSPLSGVRSGQIKQSLAPALTDSQIKQALRSPFHSPSPAHFAYKSVVQEEVTRLSRPCFEDDGYSSPSQRQEHADQGENGDDEDYKQHRRSDGQSGFSGRWQLNGAGDVMRR